MPPCSVRSRTRRAVGARASLTSPALGGLPAGRSGHGVIAGGGSSPATGTGSDVFRLTPTPIGRATMEPYVGLDVSLDTTAVCVLDGAGKVVWRGRCSSTPDAIARVVREHAPTAVRIGLEAGQLSTWLVHGLRQLGLPAICLDARHAKAALSLQINKTDDNDALGLAHIVRTGWYREVAVKSMDSQTVRVLLMARAQLVSQRQTTANLIRGLLKTFGLLVGQAGGGRFAVRVRELTADSPA